MSAKPVSIGRDPNCDISILDGHVSRMHCQVEAIGEAIYLTDLGSRNTTLVNGRPVQRCVLHAGDEIGIGNVRLLVSDATAKAPEAQREHRPGSTVSIRQSSGFYVRGKRADFLTSNKAHTIYDLADLYSLSRRLWTSGSQQDVVNRSAAWIAERFAPSHIWHASNSHSAISIDEVFRVPDGTAADPPRKHCERTIQSQDGLLIPMGETGAAVEDRETLIVVPLIVGPDTIGAIAVQSHPKRNVFDEDDLELLLAVGCIAAPWYRAMAALESLHEEANRLRKVRPGSPVLVGSSPVMEAVREAIHRAAQSDLNVVIAGETGVGKEIAARLIHDLSARRDAPFVAVNCAAIPKDLFESELFGYEKGAFTGADRGKKGLLDECHGGTLFLDEVGDLSLENQARLLRAIETRAFRRLGGAEEHRADFRVVSATNLTLSRAIHDRSFRSDLYYRLNAIEIGMPPLRDHTSDIPELVEHFLHLVRLSAKRPLKGITPEALDALRNREWPGNVRELKASIERAAALSPDGTIRPQDMATHPSHYGTMAFPTLAELENRHILEAINKAQGRMTEAARLLGIGRTTLYEKLAKLNPNS